MDQTITALKVQKRNKQRVNVYLDGSYAFGLSRIVAAWLTIGQIVTPQKIIELKSSDTDEVAFQRALNFLSYRPRSAWEIESNLRKHDVDEEIINQVLARLIEKKFINDTEFAELWVENRSAFKPRGARMLRMELRQKRVPEEDILKALLDLDERQLVYKAALSRAPRFKNLEWNEFRNKLYGYLSRRGFNYENISEIVSKVWEEIRNEEEVNEVIT
ncbi:MAG: RecX family transcriptional regulator [Chloroflexota bacterium]